MYEVYVYNKYNNTKNYTKISSECKHFDVLTIYPQL